MKQSSLDVPEILLLTQLEMSLCQGADVFIYNNVAFKFSERPQIHIMTMKYDQPSV